MQALLVLFLAAVAQCRMAPVYRVTPNIPGQYIVTLEDGINVRDFATNMRFGTVRKTLTGLINAVVLSLDDDMLNEVRSLKGVKMIEEDGLATIANVRDVTDYWGLDRIDQDDLPLDGNFETEGDGAGVNVYILDTGIRYSHSEFGDRAQPFHDNLGDGLNGADCNGHGTHCAGTVGGSTSGVATAVNLWSVRVLGCDGSGSNSDIIDGLTAVAADTRPNRVASMSLSGGLSESLNNVVAAAHDAGVVVVVAAGNNSADACNYSPASAPKAITVGATTITDGRSSFSNWGACLDIFAPGSDIKSADYSGDNSYSTKSGTSMACSHVTGVTAIEVGEHGAAMTPDQVAEAIINDASPDKITDPGTGSPNLLLHFPNDHDHDHE